MLARPAARRRACWALAVALGCWACGAERALDGGAGVDPDAPAEDAPAELVTTAIARVDAPLAAAQPRARGVTLFITPSRVDMQLVGGELPHAERNITELQLGAQTLDSRVMNLETALEDHRDWVTAAPPLLMIDRAVPYSRLYAVLSHLALHDVRVLHTRVETPAGPATLVVTRPPPPAPLARDDSVPPSCIAPGLLLGADGVLLSGVLMSPDGSRELSSVWRLRDSAPRWVGHVLESLDERCPTVPRDEGALERRALLERLNALRSLGTSCPFTAVRSEADIPWSDLAGVLALLESSGRAPLLVRSDLPYRCREAFSLKDLDLPQDPAPAG
ncbi:MAG: hypothetical protein H6713_15130 [Myxococcales bacterium]|nr:hypothetical protein [Myxococcales bacterium]